jgi:hypothetical protein
MNTTAKLFAKDGATEFTSTDGKTISMCVDVTDESLDLTTGFVREERMLFWVKGNSAESVKKNVDVLIATINRGTLRAYRAFSNSPFYAGQSSDINPTTGTILNRYSQVRLCPSAQFDTLHRQYVVNVEVATEEVTA